MRLTNYYMPTLRDNPQDAETVSHKLLTRAAFIRKSVSGIYSYLPLGMKVIDKIEKIVKLYMQKYDSIEIKTSILQPREIWEKSDRWANFGPEMFKIKDRHDREYCLAPTAEEYFTYLIKDELNSYKQLPLNLFQIASKFRDEKRPRFGINRSRDFIMKDAYSFDEDFDKLQVSYQKMWDAYVEIFDALKLDYKIVQGDTGAMGGRKSHEFIALSESGEGAIFYSDKSDYAATDEKCEFFRDYKSDEPMQELEEVYTENLTTIDQISEFFKVSKSQCAKCIDLNVDGKAYFVLIPGDRELNMTKLLSFLKVSEHTVEMMDDDMIEKYTSAKAGYTGPVGLSDEAIVVVDKSITEMRNMIIGANKTHYHFKNANFKRDFDALVADDLLMAREGDLTTDKKGVLKKAYGIEVGNIFQLGTKYSEALEAYYLDKNGKQKPFVMGSYGIGITRSISAVVEQNHDDKGIIWPTAVAPFEAWITVVNDKNEEQLNLANEIYEQLKLNHIDVVIDDRKERAGVKFNDRDLIGVPYRITVGKNATENLVEYSKRDTMQNELLNYKEAIEKVIKSVKQDLE